MSVSLHQAAEATLKTVELLLLGKQEQVELALLLPGALILGFVGFNLRPTQSRDALVRAQQRFEKVATSLGYQRRPSETYGELARRIKTEYSDSSSALDLLAFIEQRMRYSPEDVGRDELIRALKCVTADLRIESFKAARALALARAKERDAGSTGE